MTVFWLLVAFSFFLATLMSLFALRSSAAQKRALQQDKVNVALTQSRLTELQQEESQSLLSSSGRVQAEKELKLALAHELNGGVISSSQTQITGRRGYRIILLFCLLIVIGITTISYVKVNQVAQVLEWDTAIQRLPNLGKRIVIEADPSIERKDLADFALGIRTRLHNDPNDSIGWLLLGRVNIALNQVSQGLLAYENSLALNPSHKGTIISFSQALLMTGTDRDTEKAFRLLKNVIQNSDEFEFDLWRLYALAATMSDRKNIAKQSWRNIIVSLNKGDPRLSIARQQLKRLNSGDLGITVKITLNKGLTIPTGATLFVFAQSEETGAIPLAVKKLSASPMPNSVVLTVEDAMMEQYTLQRGQEVVITVRLSQDANIETQINDLQGKSELVEIDSISNSIDVIIDHIVTGD